MFFQIAKPLPKEEFLSVYKEAVLLTQLLFAPVGLAEEACDTLNEDDALATYTSEFQQFEDLVSKRIFSIRGYEDDRIIASMHEFAGESQDAEVLQEMHAATAALRHMLAPPPVVEYDFSASKALKADFNVVSPRTAALLLHRVLSALAPTLYGEQCACAEGEYSVEGASLYAQNLEAQRRCGTRIPLASFSPACEFAKAPFSRLSLRSRSAVDGLLSALVPPAADVTATTPVLHCGTWRDAITSGDALLFSLQQYHCLLDLFGDSAEVQGVIAHHLRSPAVTLAPPTVRSIRTGLLLGSLNLSADPTVCHVSQLSARLAQLKRELPADTAENRADNGDGAEGSERSTVPAAASSELQEQLSSVSNMLEATLQSLEKRRKAKESGEGGNFAQAVQLLTEGLLGELEGEHSGDQGSGGEGSAGVASLPCHIKVALWTDRATYSKEAGDLESALRDTDRAIALETHSAAAYSLRSHLRLQQLEEAHEEDAEEGGGAGHGDRLSVDELELLQQAAEDGLLAFLLAGSSDLSLAAAAEEAAREACRHSAKSIFHERRRGAATESGAAEQDNLPRSWLVASYFGAYEPLSSALGVYHSSTAVAGDDGDALGDDPALESVEESDNLCDIDEGDHTAQKLPSLPAHLRDVKETGDARKLLSCARDDEGYALLLCLTELMETATYSPADHVLADDVCAAFAQSNAPSPAPAAAPLQEISEIATVRQRDVTFLNTTSGATRKIHSVAASLLTFAESVGATSVAQAMAELRLDPSMAAELKSGPAVDLADFSLVQSGLCEIVDCADIPSATEIPVAAAVPTTPVSLEPRHVEACRYYRTALSLLSGRGWTAETGASSAGSHEVASSLGEHILAAASALSVDAVVQLTGVVFNPDGSVKEVVPAPVPAVSAAVAAQLQQSEQNQEGSDGGSADEDSEGDQYGDSYYRDEENEEGDREAEEFFKRAFGFGGPGAGNRGDSGSDEGEDDGEEREWETVDGSEEEGSDPSEEGGDSEEDSHPGRRASGHAQSKGKEVKNGAAKVPAKTESRTSGSSDRAADVAAALAAVEAQMQAHHLDEVPQEDSSVHVAVEPTPVAPMVVETPRVIPATVAVSPAVVSATSVPADRTAAQSDSTPVQAASPASTDTDRRSAAASPEPTDQSPPAPAAEPMDVSHRLRARLLNVCASIAYLAGDATGAVLCLRASIAQDPLLLDSQVKLGSLLVDMDEMGEAAQLLKMAHRRDPAEAVTLLHLAEMHTHQNNFDEAVRLLRKARRLAETAVASLESGAGANSEDDAAQKASEIARVRAEICSGHAASEHNHTGDRSAEGQYLQRARRAWDETLANIVALLGINLFRQLPNRPEIAVHMLQSALASQFKERPSVILLLCAGEVYSQAGDMVTALECFRKAQRAAPNNPLCYVNAARTYQQLNQISTAERHLQAALLLDPAMAMVRVDLAQNLLLTGCAAQALAILEEALGLAKQVSEIRDVLTARTIASMQVDLEERGLYCSSGARSINC